MTEPAGVAELEGVIDRVALDADPATVARALQLLDRLTSLVTEAVGRFVKGGAWADTSMSPTAWLKSHARRSVSQARVLVETAELLARSPVLAAAYRTGDVSSGQVHAVNVNVRDQIDAWTQHEADVVPMLQPLSVADSAVVMNRWRQWADSQSDEAPAPERRGFHLSRTMHDHYEGSLHLSPEGGSIVASALRAAETIDCPGEPPRRAAERRADALVELCQFYLNHAQRLAGQPRRRRPHVDVVVGIDRWAGLFPARAETSDGVSLAQWAIDTYLCDATVARVLLDAPSHVLDYGRSRRTLPAGVARAVIALDVRCRWPGCDRPPAWCDIHHLDPFAEGGPTSVANHVLLCARHHQLLHRLRCRAERAPDNTVIIKFADGRILLSRPPP